MALGDINEIDSDAWWLNREPLRSFQVGKGNGTTAADLNLTIVAHETNNFLAYESISRSHSGEPNVFVSREKATGESAAFGEGFYTRIGREGARGTGLTVRFIVKPEARVGTDFIIQDEYIIFKNKKALTVIQESLNLGINDLLKLAESDKVLQIDHSDLALLEKLKRKMNSNLINDELNKLLISKVEIDHERLVYILNSFQNSNFDKLISKDILGSISKNVFDRISAFANSKNEAELIRYIKTVGPIIKTLHSNGILNKASFINNLKELVQNPSLSFCLRQQAVFELLLLIDDFEHYFNFKKDFESNEIKTLVTEMKEWNKSQDLRKRKFAIQLNKKWSEAIENGDVKSLEAFIEIQLFEINHKTVSHNSILQLAAYYKQKSIIDWLIANPNFNFNTKNNIGLNEVDQLRLSGKGEYADFILQNRPDLQSRKFNLRERNTDQKTTDYPNGTPIIDFIRIEAGSFLMGEGEARVLTTISKPFEIMSVDITQETYRIVVELLKQNFRNGEYNDLNGTPSYFKGSSRPVEQVSYDDITLWIKGLNNLSKLDTEVQKTLEKLFPLHMIGIQYSRPTEAQWEYVSRLGGLAEGEYSHGNSDLNLEEYAVIRWNSSDQTHVVGFKKPVFYNGKPIYDIHGNVWKLIEDWYDTSLTGGKDPQGPNSGSKRIYRGGSWRDGTHVFGSGNRYYTNPSIRNEAVGFRLVRTIL
jgi:formylglycine-generating enzyme required for sulfatase activity